MSARVPHGPAAAVRARRRFWLETLGCPKNAVDSEKIAASLLADGLDPAAIESIDVRVPASYAGMISRAPQPDNRSSTMVSVAYQIALGALRPDARYNVSRLGLPFDDDITALVAKVSVSPDDSSALVAHFPARFPAAVAVRASGRAHERRMVEAAGDPGRRLDDAAVADKAARVLAVAGLDAPAGISPAAAGSALTDPAAARSIAARFGDIFAALEPGRRDVAH